MWPVGLLVLFDLAFLGHDPDDFFDLPQSTGVLRGGIAVLPLK